MSDKNPLFLDDIYRSEKRALTELSRLENEEEGESLKRVCWFCLHPAWSVREKALTLLEQKSPLLSVFAGRSLLSDPAPLVRCGAILCLMQKKTRRNALLIYPLLTDPDWTVRCEAADCLAEMPVTYTLEEIVEVYRAEPSEFVRRDLALLIKKTKSPQAVKILRELFETETEPIACLGVLATLHRLKEKDALMQMLAYLDFEEGILQDNVINGFRYLSLTSKDKKTIVDYVKPDALLPGAKADYRELLRLWE